MKAYKLVEAAKDIELIETAKGIKLIETFIVKLIDDAVASKDRNTLKELFATLKKLDELFFVEDYNQAAPFVPAVSLLPSQALAAELQKLAPQLQKLDPKLQKLVPQLQKLAAQLQKDEHIFRPQSAAGLPEPIIWIGNSLAKTNRQIWFESKILGGFNGTVILSEGDSWFQYPNLFPSIFPDDVIDHLNNDNDKAILSLGGAGDKLSEMVADKDWTEEVPDYITDHLTPKVFLLSGGGNDLFAKGKFERILGTFQDGNDPKTFIDNNVVFRKTLNEIVKNYRSVVEGVLGVEKWSGIHVFGHAYDVPIPRNNGGWIGPHLNNKDIPFNIGYGIVKHIFEAFASKLRALDKNKNKGKGIENFHFVDVERVVNKEIDEENKDFWKDEKVFEEVAQQLRNNWEDELHPNSDGFKRVADKFRKEIAAVL